MTTQYDAYGRLDLARAEEWELREEAVFVTLAEKAAQCIGIFAPIRLGESGKLLSKAMELIRKENPAWSGLGFSTREEQTAAVVSYLQSELMAPDDLKDHVRQSVYAGADYKSIAAASIFYCKADISELHQETLLKVRQLWMEDPAGFIDGYYAALYAETLSALESLDTTEMHFDFDPPPLSEEDLEDEDDDPDGYLPDPPPPGLH